MGIRSPKAVAQKPSGRGGGKMHSKEQASEADGCCAMGCGRWTSGEGFLTCCQACPGSHTPDCTARQAIARKAGLQQHAQPHSPQKLMTEQQVFEKQLSDH